MVDLVVGHDKDDFGSQLARRLGCDYRGFHRFHFPDGEYSPSVDGEYDIDGKHVLLAYRMEQQPTNTGFAVYVHCLSRVLGNLSHERLFNAETVDVLLPYYVTGRQDKNPRHDEYPTRANDIGRDVGHEWLARELRAHGARKVITFNPHYHREDFDSHTVEGLEMIPLDGIPALVRHVRDRLDIDPEKYVVMTPDANGSLLGKRFAESIGLPMLVHEKRRTFSDEVEIRESRNAGGRHVIIVDDIISTARTIRNAMKRTEDMGDVYVSAVHPVLPEVGYQAIHSMLRGDGNGRVKGVYATNTLKSVWGKADITDEVMEFVRGGE